MRAKSMVLILIALGCGLVASIAISQVMERGSGSGGTLETVQIYVATTDVDVNEQLSATNVRVEDWPSSKVPEGSILDLEQITGQFARVRFYEGEPILIAKLAAEIEGAAVKIPEGFRVCSLKVQMDTSVSGLVYPGDRVDIFGYFRRSQDIPRTGTREILRNVRVFAVNSETEQETDQEGQTIVAKTVSVLVEHDQVAKLMLATELGTLRLALRRPNEVEENSTGESATIEMLFGTTRADSADEGQTEEPGQNGFSKFLSGLRQGNTGPAAFGVASAIDATDPSWQMMILTPDGGTNFTWEDENRLPRQGSAGTVNSSVNELRTSMDAVPDTDPGAPMEEEEEEVEEEEEEEEARTIDDI